ncbi:hypothetical protein [Actinomadura geliboluensis]|uniref:hypothetical protein n=1 Tax=Actinomadura geliboluensis TaxID=882440 RepID=UPI003678B0B7
MRLTVRMRVLRLTVLHSQLAELAPAEVALDLGFGEESEGAFGEGVVDVVELLGSDDLEGLADDRGRPYSAAGVDEGDLVVHRGGEDGAEDDLLVADGHRLHALVLEGRDPRADVLREDVGMMCL